MDVTALRNTEGFALIFIRTWNWYFNRQLKCQGRSRGFESRVPLFTVFWLHALSLVATLLGK